LPVRAVLPRPGFLKGLPGPSRLLSWGSKIAPPPIRMMRVHSRSGRSPSFGRKAPTSQLVPPLSFHPTPTVSSAHHPAGLLHPATGHGVRHVSGPVASERPEDRFVAPAPSSMALTLRSFSLRDSGTVSPRPGPSRCWSPLVTITSGVLPRFPYPLVRFPQPQGFAPSQSPLLPPWRFRQGAARCSLGLWIPPATLRGPGRP